MIRVAIISILVLYVSGCGTVVRGTKQGVRFESTPTNAAVTVERAKKRKTQWNCTTPCELQLSRKRDFDVTFALAGYKPATGRLASRLGAKGGATAIPGNFVLGGGIGFIVDAGTGANMQLKPDPMRAKLAPVGSAENSVIYDVRIEGGGVEDIHETSAEQSAAISAANGDAPQLRRISRDIGAEGTTLSTASTIASIMAEPHGVVLSAVKPGGAAARAGLQNGDVVQAVNGSRVDTMEAMTAAISATPAGETAAVTVWRDRELYEAKIAF